MNWYQSWYLCGYCIFALVASSLCSMQNWMDNLGEDATRLPLINLCIPGSHDSFTHNLDVNLPVANDNKDIQSLSQGFNSNNDQYLEFKNIVLKFSQTQNLDVTEQLNLGIRYFDMRISKPDHDPEHLRIVHGLYGPKISDVLDEIHEFSTSNPKEILLLDFNHFYNMNADDHIKFINMIEQKFGEIILRIKDRISELTLEDLWEQQKSILVFYAEGISYSYDFLLSNAIVSPWPNKNDIKDVLQILERDLAARTRPKSTASKKFFVSQCIVTLNYYDVILGSSTLETVAGKVTPQVVQWIRDNNEYTYLPIYSFNIFIVDFVELAKFSETVINLNPKKNTREVTPPQNSGSSSNYQNQFLHFVIFIVLIIMLI